MTGLIEFVLADDRVSDADRHEDISRAVAFSAGGDGGRRIICDLRKRTSSIRRSSLISITLGLLTVIGGYLSFASLEEAAGQCLECPLELCIRARRYGAGRPVLSLRRWGLPASAATELMGVWGVLPYLPPEQHAALWPRLL